MWKISLPYFQENQTLRAADGKRFHSIHEAFKYECMWWKVILISLGFVE